MYFVYILKSTIAPKTYTGYTGNLSKRLKEHNSGTTKFTKDFVPWEIIYCEKQKNKEDAIKREGYLKSATGRRWVRKTIFN